MRRIFQLNQQMFSLARLFSSKIPATRLSRAFDGIFLLFKCEICQNKQHNDFLCIPSAAITKDPRLQSFQCLILHFAALSFRFIEEKTKFLIHHFRAFGNRRISRKMEMLTNSLQTTLASISSSFFNFLACQTMRLYINQIASIMKPRYQHMPTFEAFK